MKIGILTFHSAHNYGAVLQAWSLQEYLKREGHDVKIVNLRLEVIDKIYRIMRREPLTVCGNSLINWLADRGYRLSKTVYWNIKSPEKVEKYNKFEYFINHVLPVTKEFNTYEALLKAKLDFDALIVGSDQVWNAVMMKGIDPAFFLQFGKKEALRISYAASIGTEVIPEEYRLLFRRYLRDFDAISVREEKARKQVEMLTDKKVSLVSDPTFLLQKEDFDQLLKKPKISQKYIYVHNVHLKRVDEALNSVAKELSKRTGLPIVHNWNQKIFPNEAGHFTGGIEEFLGYVAGAEWVVTNSFHCTVFAITYHRKFITVPHFKHPDRMKYLLGSLGISNNLVQHGSKMPTDIGELQINYDEVEVKKSILRKDAQEFLREALCTKKQIVDKSYLEDDDIFCCYGCSACAESCRENAIVMKADKEGFAYPEVDQSKCVKCGKCKEVCISHKTHLFNRKEENLPRVYAAYHKNEQVLEESTSGGVFTAIYRSILAKNGVVAGVRYDESMEVIYDFAENEEECSKFRGTKYIAAQGNIVLEKVRNYLEAGRCVLFSGTPCQIAGLKSYLDKDYENLYTVDMICHGVGSPKLFRAYRNQIEKTYQSKLVKFEFHNKFKGADNPFIVTEFETGCIDVEDCSRNNLSRAYAEGYIQRPSCYTCEFADLKKSVADITLGNFQGVQKHHPEMENKKGVSVLKVNTNKGMLLFDEFKEELVLAESSSKSAFAGEKGNALLMRSARAEFGCKIDEKAVEELLFDMNNPKQ